LEEAKKIYAYKADDFFTCRKGRSWSVPNVDELPEIDFESIARKINLRFNEDICQSIKWELALYVSQVRVWEERPLARKRKAQLRKIEKACELLESVFELDAYGKQEEFDSMQQYLWRSVSPHVECFLVCDGRGKSRLAVKGKKPFEFSDRGQLPFDGITVADYLDSVVTRYPPIAKCTGCE